MLAFQFKTPMTKPRSSPRGQGKGLTSTGDSPRERVISYIPDG